MRVFSFSAERTLSDGQEIVHIRQVHRDASVSVRSIICPLGRAHPYKYGGEGGSPSKGKKAKRPEAYVPTDVTAFRQYPPQANQNGLVCRLDLLPVPIGSHAEIADQLD